ncbi:MAG: glycosyltransferase involved in cell wall biosynthesis [Flavobacteriales bacterium]|jgi:glycosyltransferase involved in cell wall biosynthesis
MLAIVIPYFKLAFFDETLQSLASQTVKRFKVYIGDDASPENPAALLEKYQGKFDFEYHRFDTNLGGISLTQQWERCIALTGNEEWIMILGDDDYISEDVVEQFYVHLPEFQSKSNVVRFASRTIVQEENHKATICRHPLWESATDAFYKKFQLINRSSLSEYVFSKKVYEKHGFYNYPLAWYSDDRAWLDFSEDKPIYSINEGLVNVRLSTLNITGRTDNLELKNQATARYYHYLMHDKLKGFNTYERIKIIRKYYFELKKIKTLETKDWVFITKNYIANINILSINDYIKKYI